MWIENPHSNGILPKFERVELPEFSVIIGPNGVGKTQLLKGIKSGVIACEVSPISSVYNGGVGYMTDEIVLLSSNDGDPPGLTGSLSSDLNALIYNDIVDKDLLFAKRNLLDARDRERKEIDKIVTDATGKSLIEHGYTWSQFCKAVLYEGHEPRKITPFGDPYKYQTAIYKAESILHDIAKQEFGKTAYEFSPVSPAEKIIAVDDEKLLSRVRLPTEELFVTNITNTFLSYREKRWQNQFKRLADLDEGTSRALSPEEFIELFGTPPWERVSEAFRAFNLPYSVLPASYRIKDSVSFELIRDKDGKKLSFANLSAGEKVIARMALAAFQSSYEKLIVHPAKLILLDEVDAALHPENVKRWMESLITGYVEKLKISCIVSTHSPTTVALAPDNAIYEMTENDAKPRPISKQGAIDRLTAGLPSISIDYSNRRQVFTESSIDSNHYSMIYDVMRPRLELQKSLTFIGTYGSKGGCDLVRDIVKQMATNGNRSVFGVLDWDAKNKPDNRVRVLGEGTHYTKENVLFDPLLLGALLIKDGRYEKLRHVPYSSLKDAPNSLLQSISDIIVDSIKFSPGAKSQIGSNSYFGGFSLSVSGLYQMFPGHDLFPAIKIAFPDLGRFQGESGLCAEIISRVIADIPEFCPMPFVKLMTELANAEP